MKENIAITCPVSTERINENGARFSAFFTILIAGIGFFFNAYPVFLILALDFAVRAFTNGDFSPLRFFSKSTVKALKIRHKPADAAPKKFAASLGMVFCFLIAALLFFQLTFAAKIAGAALFFCAFLESAFSYCIGCVIYTFVVLPFQRSQK